MSIAYFSFILVGKPIHVDKNIDPTQFDIDQLHSQYLNAVETLYYTNRDTYGLAHVPLKII